jgi:hypothetical protein
MQDPAHGFPRRPLLRLSEKSLSELWSIGFGDAILQKQVLYAQFRQFVRASVRKFESFQTVSLGSWVNKHWAGAPGLG